MDLTVKVLLFTVLANSINTELTTEISYEDTTDVSTTVATFTTTTESKPINTIDILQYQLNQILVQFCASEIDRNKTASAILKFGQLVDAKNSMINLVEFYIDNYAESFDNLLLFIDQTSSLEVQNVAYNTLVEATKLNRINVINLLSFERFIRTKFEWTDADDEERKVFGDLLLTVANEIRELVVATDLNRLITVINGSDNPSRIFELIPRIVQGIDLTNFKDMDRIFHFSMQLPLTNQLKLINEVLSEMGRKIQYQHLFHVILQIRSLRNSVNILADRCLLSSIENQIPPGFEQLLSDSSMWQINFDFHSSEGYLTYESSAKYSKTLLFVTSNKHEYSWHFKSGRSSNSVSVYIYGRYQYNNLYISVDYCFHNDSFPVLKGSDSSDDTQDKWYLLMSSDHTYLQLKNIYTNELLIVDDIRDMVDSDGMGRSRIALSAHCSDCDASKFSIELTSRGYTPLNHNCQ